MTLKTIFQEINVRYRAIYAPAICTLLCSALLAALPAFGARSGSAGIFDVRGYGAKGDGKTLDTAAINAAIDGAALAGGGTVRFPAGSYLSTSIHLKSGVTLDIGPGATIIAAAPGKDIAYDAAEDTPEAGNYEDFGHRHWHNSLIWGENLHDIAIIGSGRIWGRDLARDEVKDETGVGNKSIALKLCRNVILRDFTIEHGGWFGILATGVDNLTIDNLKIDTNRDGMDIDCCRSVRVSNCSVNSPYDDGICLKSSYGLGFARATENVTIDSCQVSGYKEGTFLDGTYARGQRGGTGRIKFGTEANGGFKNITVSNCVFDFCCGLALEEVDGGNLENVAISNITMRDIANAPIFIRLGGRLRGPAGTAMSVLRRVSISHVIVHNADTNSAAIIAGVPDGHIEDISLDDIHIWFKGGGTAAQAAITPPEDEKGYPEPDRLGKMPAYGFYIRHVHGITMHDIQLRTLSQEQRPAFLLDDVTDARFNDVDAAHDPDAEIFTFKDAARVRWSQVLGLPDGERK